MRARLLLVEDEAAIAEPLAESLEREGFVVEVAGTVAAAEAALGRREPDLLLLDVMLPDGDGRDLCRRVRAGSDVPIVMLTARGEEIDRVLGLELGADDYVVKPFSARELAARVRAILRRGRSPRRAEGMAVGGLRLEPAARRVTRHGEEVELPPREFDLLHALMRRAGEVVRREELMEEVWDRNWFGSTKTLDVHVASLRKRIEDEPSRPRYITTVRGVGFRFASPADAPRARGDA
jgi:DNA-binding response OmpR family regulator